jgi:ATP-dependent DNA helicase RecQ
MEAILEALEGATSMTVPALERKVNIRRGQIEKALKLLEIDGAVAHERGRYFRTANPWHQDEARIQGIKAIRRAELKQMRAYMTHDGCLMAYLTTLLDDPAPGVCGRCSVDLGHGFPREVDPVCVRTAVRFLRRDRRVIEPRRRWADGAGGAGAIKPPNERGVALCVYGDAGWGRAVHDGKYVEGRFSDELVVAAVEATREFRGPGPAPTWVTAIPSRSRSGLVGDLAARMALALGLEFRKTLTVRVDGAAQNGMLNSVQQERNARHNLDIDGSAVLPGPVLLVDDIVDSRWTMTVAGWLLRSHGSGPVSPFALALASQRDS